MNAIVFLGSNKSDSSYEAIRAAEAMRYYTVLLTDRQSFLNKRMDFPYIHSLRACNLNSLADIKNTIDILVMQRIKIHAIVSFLDPYCHTAALLSREYGLKYFSANAIAAMLDKIKTREALAKTPYSPFYRIAQNSLPPPDMLREMPLVLKSPLSSASKDVHLIESATKYQQVFIQLRGQYPSSPILVEKYVDGPQYLVETLTIGKKINIIAVIEQEITFFEKFIVTGYKMITRDDAFIRSLKEAVRSIVSAFGMEDGPCHLELRYSGSEWKLIEANPRLAGGAMNLFIETACGLNLAKETLKCALGLPVDLSCKYKKETFMQYVVVQRGGVLQKVTGKHAALDSSGVERVYVKPKKGSVLTPPVSMGHRYAYVIATGDSGEEARQNAKAGASMIKFHLLADRENIIGTGQSNAALEGLDEFSGNVVLVSR